VTPGEHSPARERLRPRDHDGCGRGIWHIRRCRVGFRAITQRATRDPDGQRQPQASKAVLVTRASWSGDPEQSWIQAVQIWKPPFSMECRSAAVRSSILTEVEASFGRPPHSGATIFNWEDTRELWCGCLESRRSLERKISGRHGAHRREEQFI